MSEGDTVFHKIVPTSYLEVRECFTFSLTLLVVDLVLSLFLLSQDRLTASK